MAFTMVKSTAKLLTSNPWRSTLKFERQLKTSINLKKSLRAEDTNTYKKLKKKQERYQIDDGVDMYLKGGAVDKFLFTFILVGTIFSVAKNLYDWYPSMVSR